MKWWDVFLELLYPTCCPGCGAKTDLYYQWCESCVKEFWNPRLLNSSYTEHLDGCYTLCNYEGALRQCILQMKYGRKSCRKRVFPMLLDRFPWWDRLKNAEDVIPIPLSRFKYQKRGYNQVDLMFRSWMKSHGRNYLPHGLVRIRNTETQSLLAREERYRNINGVFHINRNINVRHHFVLLLDDVYTTGATMESAAGELKRVGARRVTGLTIASGAL